ncbi:MAG TPA: Stk1 family PASTA domain-containing Ser/Thr kinase, partial [Mobilitalea sp.]|nr:Stk1 family PASTA domain-containing Ser/Thr kinase [Mobilitalea sp.]
MADVYKAKDQRLNRFVAIKVLKPEYASDTSFVNKFIGEAQSAAGLSHPNIVNVYDVGNENGLHYIVMEFIEGITLKRFIERKGKLDIKEAVGIAIQIAQGMEAAHDNNIIHRDIKPQNIIISKDGKVKVTDFGIAKASNSNTITSNAMGSVHYLSPEQARGGYSDEKSDIYSLGVTLYEMLSGQVPFAGDNTVSVALSHLQQEPIPLRELDENIPVSLDKIVQKCMQKRPERRYHSASELIADLKRALTNPDGDFVQIPAFVANDSPTINISNDLGRIKNGAYSTDTLHNRKDDKAIDDDDEDLEAMDDKVDKIFSIITIVTIVIVTIAIFYIVARFILPKKDDEPNTDPIVTEMPTPEPTEALTPTPEPTQAVETYKVPNVKGLKYEDAKATIEAKDPTALVRPEEEYSTEEPGFVVRQYPNPDTDFPVGSEVILYVSVGPESFKIPYVYGLTKEQAEQKLSEVGLKAKFETMNSNEIQAGKVISTDPPKESVVKEGDTITVYISAGPEVNQAAVPDLIGKTVEEAKNLLA